VPGLYYINIFIILIPNSGDHTNNLATNKTNKEDKKIILDVDNPKDLTTFNLLINLKVASKMARKSRNSSSDCSSDKRRKLNIEEVQFSEERIKLIDTMRTKLLSFIFPFWKSPEILKFFSKELTITKANLQDSDGNVLDCAYDFMTEKIATMIFNTIGLPEYVTYSIKNKSLQQDVIIPLPSISGLLFSYCRYT